jgi:fructokinase
MGAKGVFLASDMDEPYQISATSDLEVVDVTGAGDAYWAGFFSAYLRDCSLLEAACIGQAFAELKISQVGPIQEAPSWEILHQKAETIKYVHLKPDAEQTNHNA